MTKQGHTPGPWTIEAEVMDDEAGEAFHTRYISGRRYR